MADDLFSVPNSGVPFSYFIDLSLVPDWTPELASGVDHINILFGSTSDNLVVKLNKISFTSIPEPSTVALMILGLSALAASRRRRCSL